MYVSMDFEVDGDVTPEEAIQACREYIISHRSEPNYVVEVNRTWKEEKTQVMVTQTLIRASYQPAALPGETQ